MNSEMTAGGGPEFSRGEGVLPAIAQDAENGQVLMLAYMNAEAFAETVETGYATYYSRSRKRLWRKGELSGHRQQVCSIHLDCDADAILLKVRQVGAACHQGYRSCFFRRLTDGQWLITESRLVDPATVYSEPRDLGHPEHSSARPPNR